MSTKEGGMGWREAEAPPPETESIVWSEDAGRFQTESIFSRCYAFSRLIYMFLSM